jgi:hypothetical protein
MSYSLPFSAVSTMAGTVKAASCAAGGRRGQTNPEPRYPAPSAISLSQVSFTGPPPVSQQLHSTDVRALIHLLDAARAGRNATPGWLGSQLGLNSASVTALVDRLEDAELSTVRRFLQEMLSIASAGRQQDEPAGKPPA